jgi:hypothetical protein
MSDLYSVLKQSILDRGLRSPAAREEVYSQARTAMIRQLWSYDPPLAEDEIDARVGQFDTAVERIESDLVVTFAGASALPRRVIGRARQARAAEKPAPVFEGYDEEADYAPAFGGRAAPPPEEAAEAAADDAEFDDLPDRVRRWHRRGDTDPLEARRAAIEDALRPEASDDAEAEDGQEAYRDEPPAYADEPVDRGDAYRNDRRAARDEDFRGEARDGGAGSRSSESEGRGEEDYGDEAPPTVKRGIRGGARNPAAGWASFDERTRVRILIGAIAAFAVVLIALAAYIIVPLMSESDTSPAIAADGPAASGKASDRIGAPGAVDAANIAQSFVVFDGSDPTVFDSGSENPVRFDKDDAGGFARVASSASDAGVHVTIGPGLANRLAGRSVRVTVTARSARENGAVGMRFAYQSGVAISPWQTVNLTGGYTTSSLIWRLPAMRTNPAGDYLLVEPGIPGDGTAAEIQSIQIDLLKQEAS